MRGFFTRADGLVLPNNVTTYGASLILSAAFQDATFDIYVALCHCVPSQTLGLHQLGEPIVDIGGYARQEIARDETGWPYLAELNDEPYVETDWFTFPATDEYSSQVSRLALVSSPTATWGDGVIALGSSFDPVVFDAGTPENLRTFRYRLFLR